MFRFAARIMAPARAAFVAMNTNAALRRFFPILAVLLFATHAHADACKDAVDASNRAAHQALARSESATNTCDKNQIEIDALTSFIPLAERAERICGVRSWTKCDSACVRKRVTELRAEAAKECGAATGSTKQPSSTGSSRQPDSTPAAKPHLWLPTKESPDCGSANGLERNTAAWYDTCMPPKPAKSATGYRPRIDPQALLSRAQQTCKLSPSRDSAQCYVNAKVRILLEQDPDIRAACLSKSSGSGDSGYSNALINCVDDAYVYGPNGPPSLRERLAERLRNRDAGTGDSDLGGGETQLGESETRRGGSVHRCAPPATCCPPGYGMKPTPGAFGAWSCQKLGSFLRAGGQKGPNGQGDSGGVEAAIRVFEQRLFDIAAASAAVAADAVGARMSAKDREECMLAASADVYSVLKGGAPSYPEKCVAMADAARQQLAFYARTHINPYDRAVEELVSQLRDREQNASGSSKEVASAGDGREESKSTQRQQGDDKSPRNVCGWYAIYYCSKDRSLAEVEARKASAYVVDTSDTKYPKFARGWFCSMNGPMDKDAASTSASSGRAKGFTTAYIKNPC